MLQIKNISKKYVTGDLTQIALNDISFNLRDNEFVAVLGQSGSGKTTLLNIIGGLDRYDSGDIIINGISTKDYTDRDWDSYRNHTIGFVFQSYNLIPHQTVLSNVELALTISGMSKSERRKKAKEALEKVGLGDQIHKRPNQMSGGQMQRVAIARALVNDPDILLADEPTGALDSETSVQVMELLREVANDRLVVLVTHNNELADKYANRIIRLHDGNIVGDSNPYEVDEENMAQPKHENMGKSSMSLLTSLSLSFNNLRTKKGRTFLTAFAGSIGIIGIALILALSNGVNDYIDDIQRETMVSYPISITAQSLDLSSIISSGNMGNFESQKEVDHDLNAVYSDSGTLEMASTATSSIKTNNLTKFKQYLDDPDSEIHEYVGDNGIVYSYGVKFDAYTYDPDGELVNTDGSTLGQSNNALAFGGMNSMALGISTGNFEELLPGSGDKLISDVVTENYELLHGKWPQTYDELVLVLDEKNEISTVTLYQLGLLPSNEYKELMEKINSGTEVEFESYKWSYKDIIEQTFHLIPVSDYYVEADNGLFEYIGDDRGELENLIENAVELKIVGVVRPTEDATYTSIYGNIGYTSALTNYLIEYTNNSPIVAAQEENPSINILNGMTFEPKDDATKAEDAKEYISALGITDKANLFKEMASAAYGGDSSSAARIASMSEVEMAAMLDQFLIDPDEDMLLSIYDSYISVGNYDENMKTFGFVSLEAPSSINIYADNFEDKEAISVAIANYNKTVESEDQITYTDYVGLLMSSVTTIINVISYVLIAFVAVSLVVSSIMIGIITYISVLERTKEIGILRAIGASKKNISQVFNAETFIVGSIAGLLGVGITYLTIIPVNAIIHKLTGITTVNAALPIGYAALLVILSMALTLIAGLIPSKTAAKKDPVVALRME